MESGAAEQIRRVFSVGRVPGYYISPMMIKTQQTSSLSRAHQTACVLTTAISHIGRNRQGADGDNKTAAPQAFRRDGLEFMLAPGTPSRRRR